MAFFLVDSLIFWIFFFCFKELWQLKLQNAKWDLVQPCGWQQGTQPWSLVVTKVGQILEKE